jgi:hypothetical protein
MDHQACAKQRDAAPNQKQHQRQPEKRTFFRLIPEEDFAKQSLYHFPSYSSCH